MEEDIKILEEFINYKNINNSPYHLIAISHERLCEAIENLIARDKELEKHYEHEQEYINGEVFSAKQMHFIDDEYIPKSKVIETIKNIEEVLDFAKTGQDNKSKIQCEILENLINKLKQELLD